MYSFLVIYPSLTNWKLLHPCDVNYCNAINVNHVFLLDLASIQIEVVNFMLGKFEFY